MLSIRNRIVRVIVANIDFGASVWVPASAGTTSFTFRVTLPRYLTAFR